MNNTYFSALTDKVLKEAFVWLRQRCVSRSPDTPPCVKTMDMFSVLDK